MLLPLMVVAMLMTLVCASPANPATVLAQTVGSPTPGRQASSPTPRPVATATPIIVAAPTSVPVNNPPQPINITPVPVKTAAPTPTTVAASVVPTITLRPSPSPTPGPKLVTRPPEISAPSAILIDVNTGKILYAKDANHQRPQASTTKITTALTFLNLYPKASDLELTTVVNKDDLIGEANMGLLQNEKIRLSTLLLGLLTNSANEAGISLARYAGQRIPGPAEPVERFVAAMNAYALSIGMYDTHFMNPHGLDQAGHYSSAYDLAVSGLYALRNPTLMRDAQYKNGTVDGHYIYNVNAFLTRYPGATGIKPGLTNDAGRCLVASATNNGNNLIGVVMASGTRFNQDIDSLMDYGFTLMAGKADTAVGAINLGSMRLPDYAVQPAKPTLKNLTAALRIQLEYSLWSAIGSYNK